MELIWRGGHLAPRESMRSMHLQDEVVSLGLCPALCPVGKCMGPIPSKTGLLRDALLSALQHVFPAPGCREVAGVGPGGGPKTTALQMPFLAGAGSPHRSLQTLNLVG